MSEGPRNVYVVSLSIIVTRVSQRKLLAPAVNSTGLEVTKGFYDIQQYIPGDSYTVVARGVADLNS